MTSYYCKRLRKGGKKDSLFLPRGSAPDEKGEGTATVGGREVPASPGRLRERRCLGTRGPQGERIAGQPERWTGRWRSGRLHPEDPSSGWMSVCASSPSGAPGSSLPLFTAFLLLSSRQPWNSPSDTPILTLPTPPHFARRCLHLRFPYGRARGCGESQELAHG